MRQKSALVKRLTFMAALALGTLLGATPAAGAAAPSHVSGFVVFYDNGASARVWHANASAYHAVYLDSATLGTGGAIEDGLPPSALRYVAQHHLEAYLAVSNYGATNWDPRELRVLFASPAEQQKLVRNLARTVQDSPLSGINLDFEEVAPKDASAYVRFLAAAETALHREHKLLTVDVPAITPLDTWDGGYHDAGIAKNVDQVLVMTYDYSYQGGPPGPIAPVWWVRKAAIYAEHRIPLNKLSLGIPVYSYDWYGNQSPERSLDQVATLIHQYHAAPQWNAAAEEPYFTYTDASGQQHTVYYENVRSIAAKLALARQLHIQNVFTWYVGSESLPVWYVLRRYRP